jgi:hypothetical protein
VRVFAPIEKQRIAFANLQKRSRSRSGRDILMNTPLSRGRELAAGMKERRIEPEWEVFSPTHILQDVTTLIAVGHDDGPHFINLVMNVHRNFQNAMPFSPRHFQMMVDCLTHRPDHPGEGHGAGDSSRSARDDGPAASRPGPTRVLGLLRVRPMRERWAKVVRDNKIVVH